MAKQSGIGGQLFVAGYDLSGDVGNLTRIANPSALLDVTGIDKTGYERIYGLYDGAIEFQSFFNDASSQEHEVLKAKGSAADRVATYFQGSTLGNVAAGLVSKQVNYDGNRGQDGSLTYQVQCLGNGHGLDWCIQHTAGKRTDSSATNGTGVDGGAATSLGLAAYIEVFSLSSGTPTVKLQESSDNGAGDAWADVTGGTFGVVTAPSAARIVTSLSLSVERYLRVVTTGTFSNLVFAVCVTRFPYA